MYAWIWRHLPGPFPVRALIALVVVAVVVGALFAWAFPWLDSRMPFNNVTVIPNR